MHLLAWHGSVLGSDPASGAWFHAMPWPADGTLQDLDLPIATETLTHPTVLGDLVAEPASGGVGLHLRRGQVYLCADPFRAALSYDRQRPGPLETFLPLSADMLARLRSILGSLVRVAETGALCRPRLGDGFTLLIDTLPAALATSIAAGDSGMAFEIGGRTHTLVPERPVAAPERVALRPRAASPVGEGGGRDVAVIAELAAATEYAYAPLTVSDADQVWMQTHPWRPEGQTWGAVTPLCRINRARDAFVLLARGLEGTVFTEDGLQTDSGYLDSIAVGGNAPFSRTGPTAFIEAQSLRDAPIAAGPHAVFYGGNLSNYFHWLIEALVPLSIMAPHLPPGTRLLLPGTIRTMRDNPNAPLMADHLALLDLWGFGGLPRTIVDGNVCRVEALFWIDDANLDQLPASALIAARERVLARTPPDGAARRRILVRRSGTRQVHNAAELEAAAGRLGFEPHDMRSMTPVEQLQLFRQAEWIIAPHGADLANLIYCPPGTRVIELSPALQFRPFFAQLSDKLGLCHAVLPCPTLDGSFHGHLHVDVPRLGGLFGMMQARL